MNPKRIFVTGASGCIGHYLTEALIRETNHELYLLVRNPEKLKVDLTSRPGIEVLHADMQDIDKFRPLLETVNVAVLAATAWGGARETHDINVVKTLRLMDMLDPEACEQIIYFSTASILDRNRELLKKAGQIGTEYILSKYQCFSSLSRIRLASRITTLFPTLVFGGERRKPYSHISAGLPEILKWMWLIRFFQAEGNFHFIHARDIAQIARYLIDNPPEPCRPFVLGNPAISINLAVEEMCRVLGKQIYVRLPLTPWLTNFFIRLFRIQMSNWDRFCLEHRDFSYQDAVNPAAFGLPVEYGTLAEIIKGMELVGDRMGLAKPGISQTSLEQAEEAEGQGDKGTGGREDG